MKILVTSATLERSGVPLAQIRLAKAFQSRGHDVSISFLHAMETAMLKELESINYEILDSRRIATSLPRVMRHLSIERPDIIFCAEDGYASLIALACFLTRSKARLVASSRVNPSDDQAYRWLGTKFKPTLLFGMFTLALFRIDLHTCVSEDMAINYARFFPLSKHWPVYNIIVGEESDKLSTQDLPYSSFCSDSIPVIIAATRFDREKGILDVIDAFARVRKVKEARLVLLGDGPLYKYIVEQTKLLGIDRNVVLVGSVSNPYMFFRHADIFVHASYAEGMPNVLIEAMRYGCTPVCTQCPTGPREVLSNGAGYLSPVGDSQQLAANLVKAIEAPVKGSILHKSTIPFEADSVIDKYNLLLGIRL